MNLGKYYNKENERPVLKQGVFSKAIVNRAFTNNTPNSHLHNKSINTYTGDNSFSQRSKTPNQYNNNKKNSEFTEDFSYCSFGKTANNSENIPEKHIKSYQNDHNKPPCKIFRNNSNINTQRIYNNYFDSENNTEVYEKYSPIRRTNSTMTNRIQKNEANKKIEYSPNVKKNEKNDKNNKNNKNNMSPNVQKKGYLQESVLGVEKTRRKVEDILGDNSKKVEVQKSWKKENNFRKSSEKDKSFSKNKKCVSNEKNNKTVDEEALLSQNSKLKENIKKLNEFLSNKKNKIDKLHNENLQLKDTIKLEREKYQKELEKFSKQIKAFKNNQKNVEDEKDRNNKLNKNLAAWKQAASQSQQKTRVLLETLLQIYNLVLEKRIICDEQTQVFFNDLIEDVLRKYTPLLDEFKLNIPTQAKKNKKNTTTPEKNVDFPLKKDLTEQSKPQNKSKEPSENTKKDPNDTFQMLDEKIQQLNQRLNSELFLKKDDPFHDKVIENEQEYEESYSSQEEEPLPIQKELPKNIKKPVVLNKKERTESLENLDFSTFKKNLDEELENNKKEEENFTKDFIESKESVFKEFRTFSEASINNNFIQNMQQNVQNVNNNLQKNVQNNEIYNNNSEREEIVKENNNNNKKKNSNILAERNLNVNNEEKDSFCEDRHVPQDNIIKKTLALHNQILDRKNSKENTNPNKENKENINDFNNENIKDFKKEFVKENKENIKDFNKKNEQFVQAKFDFEAQKENDLNFKKGDQIKILKKNENGWWIGLCHNKIGFFPFNYVSNK